jgi:hypothetical protein
MLYHMSPKTAEIIFGLETTSAGTGSGLTSPTQLAAGTMATQEEMKEFLRTEIASDLTFIWDDVAMPLQLQHTIGQLYRTVRLFASMADDRPGAREMGPDFGQDTASAVLPTRAAAKAAMAMVVAAWETAKDFVTRETSMRAESKVLQIARPIGRVERKTMRKAVELVQGKLPVKLTPDPDYLSAKLEEVEQDEPRASPLDEVVSVEDSQSMPTLTSALDPQGRVIITKTKSKGKMPTTTEALRQKLRLEGNTWLMIASKCRHKEYLQDLTLRDFDDLADYLLGEKVLGLQVTNQDGSKLALDPPFPIVLSYEFALRTEAFRRALEEECASSPHTFKKALKEVVKDTELKEIYFTSAITLSPSVAPAKRNIALAQQGSGQPASHTKAARKG